jgi:hypothetical protein
MNTLTLALAIGVTASSLALPSFAQDTTLPNGPKPAITIGQKPPKLPVPGKTSFTADQARARMIKRGYNLTSNPLKDDQGIWYAEGQKDDGKTVMVMMDYQGNVYEGTEYSGHPSSAPGLEPVQKEPVKPVSPTQH